ncbi:MMPL family transporter [Microbacterium sp. Se63.02b]|uniref:MMPL family transporter n=1 Tax=Microbacterium sp. Se63.02b TaxID=2709304 RepID=UPI001FCF1A01|nr:MMPL family transporter [Microbacterium sp. Se63.02b]
MKAERCRRAVGDELRGAVPDGVTVYITGPAGFSADLVAGFAGIDGLLLGVALLAVLVILVLVYRSFLLPLVVLSTSLFALCVALLVVWWLAKFEVLLLSGQTQGILFILVIGAATDYALLLVARFREELRIAQDKGTALMAAWKGSVEPIVASGGTVIAGLLCLLLSDLKSNSTLGPVAAIGIVFAMLAALTLLPSILFAFGRAAFWPRRPTSSLTSLPPSTAIRETGLWAGPAGSNASPPPDLDRDRHRARRRRSRHRPSSTPTGVPQSDLVLGSSEARDGQVALGEHFPGGSGSPVRDRRRGRLQDAAADVLLANDGDRRARGHGRRCPSGTAPVTADGIGAAPGACGSGNCGAATDDVDGDMLLQGTLTEAADSGCGWRYGA